MPKVPPRPTIGELLDKKAEDRLKQDDRYQKIDDRDAIDDIIDERFDELKRPLDDIM